MPTASPSGLAGLPVSGEVITHGVAAQQWAKVWSIEYPPRTLRPLAGLPDCPSLSAPRVGVSRLQGHIRQEQKPRQQKVKRAIIETSASTNHWRFSSSQGSTVKLTDDLNSITVCEKWLNQFASPEKTNFKIDNHLWIHKKNQFQYFRPHYMDTHGMNKSELTIKIRQAEINIFKYFSSFYLSKRD